MLRKTTCAVGGLAIACAAAFSLSLDTQPSATSLDLRWIYAPATTGGAAAKGDRLPITQMISGDDTVIAIDLPAQSTTIVSKAPSAPHLESAVRVPRTVRTVPVGPVREVPNEETTKKERMPEGCEPAFSPVTTPAFAHISSRCDS